MSRISINQRLVEFAFAFRVVDVWPGINGSKHIWLENVSPAMYQVMAIMSMWGGPTRQATVELDEGVKLREAWEIHRDHIEWFREFILRTALYREVDLAQF